MKRILITIISLLLPIMLFASGTEEAHKFENLTQSPLGYICVAGFLLSLIFIFLEGQLKIPKSIPMGLLMFFAGWLPIAIGNHGDHAIHEAFNHAFLEQSAIFFFLLGAIVMVHQIKVEGVFETVKTVILKYDLSFRSMFWLIAVLVFHISPLADNITATLMGIGVISAIADYLDLPPERFLIICIVMIIVAANNGGSWSPLGDPPATMLWLAGHLAAEDFLILYWPALASTITTGLLMHFFIPSKKGYALTLNPLYWFKEGKALKKFSVRGLAATDRVKIKPLTVGGKIMISIFVLFITVTILSHYYLNIPPAAGMLTGLFATLVFKVIQEIIEVNKNKEHSPHLYEKCFKILKDGVEWDTLLFFSGAIMYVGALQTAGYMDLLAESLFGVYGSEKGAIGMGGISALIDNVPTMAGTIAMAATGALVLTKAQWLFTNFQICTTGNLLITGTAAGVTSMGQSKHMTFLSYLVWVPTILAGSIVGTIVSLQILGLSL